MGLFAPEKQFSSVAAIDAVGAHLIGMPAYLVAPLVDADLKHTQLVRKVEGLFLKEPAPQSGICLQDDRANAVSSSREGE